ncbi:unnamed protein product [Calicophoron daubneyi]|uniref:Phosphodiesterase n=1 Tax=Calicophoron daubneyi TaxID=300641 RepID=A0AAV2TYK6_CALDB
MFKRPNRSESKVSSAMVNKRTLTDDYRLGTTVHSNTTSVHLFQPTCEEKAEEQKSAPSVHSTIHSSDAAATSFEQFYHRMEACLSRYPRDPGRMTGKPVHARSKSIEIAKAECERVWSQYFQLRSTSIPEKTQNALAYHTFNNWLHSDAQLIHYLKFMFIDLNLPQSCRFSVETLETWLLALYRRYNDVPFHNFKHAFTVTQMMYTLIKQANLVACLSPLDLLILLFSALSHDVDHPGFTNSYQVNAGTWLALRYNDESPLENHHCAVAFDLISSAATNIAGGLTSTEYRFFRKASIRCILATDMCNHAQCVAQFRNLLPTLIPDLERVSGQEYLGPVVNNRKDDKKLMDHLSRLFAEDSQTRLTVMFTLLKVCDISNESRPPSVADPWLDCLLEEFFYQARAEKRLGLPVLPHMDPDKVTRSGSQLHFLSTLLLPLLEDLGSVFPAFYPLITSVKERIAYYVLLKNQPGENDCVADYLAGVDHAGDKGLDESISRTMAQMTVVQTPVVTTASSSTAKVVGSGTTPSTSFATTRTQTTSPIHHTHGSGEYGRHYSSAPMRFVNSASGDGDIFVRSSPTHSAGSPCRESNGPKFIPPLMIGRKTSPLFSSLKESDSAPWQHSGGHHHQAVVYLNFDVVPTAPDPEVFTEHVASRKSSTGSMVAART